MMRAETLRLGRLFESEFERQLHKRGHLVVRHCDQLGVTGTKAPMVTGPWKGYRLPDFSVLANGSSYWAEAKLKRYSPIYGITGDHRHGIDLPNWRDYLAVAEKSGLPGYLIVGCCSTGEILAASFSRLIELQQIHSAPTDSFPHGGVYWPRSAFQLWGSLDITNAQMRFEFGGI